MRKAMESTQTWTQLYDYAHSLETNEATSRMLNIPVDRPVKVEFANQLLRSKSPTTEYIAKCGYCGKRRHERGERCAAKGSTCTKCGIANHFESVCRQTRAQPPQHGNRQERRQLNQVNVAEGQNEGGQLQRDAENYYLFAVHGAETSTSDEMPRISVDILGTSIDMGIDTQASLNAISREQYESMTYDGTTPMKTIGTFKAQAKANGRSVAVDIVVFDGVKSNLLGYKSCMQLGLIQLTCQVSNESDFSRQVKRKFPSLFTGLIGKLADVELVLHIDKSVRPVYEPARRIPYHLKDKVESELRAMQANDIIEDAVGWVSEMVIVPKPNNPSEIRITIDSKKANKAIMRERHNTPTIEDLAIELNGAKVLSKLDLRGGFHQIVLHPDSRDVTTFRTPLGLKRYKRLSMGVCCASEMFQHELERGLAGLTGVKNLVDDIFVWGACTADHDANLFNLLDRLVNRLSSRQPRVLRLAVLHGRHLTHRREGQGNQRGKPTDHGLRTTQLLGASKLLWETNSQARDIGKATLGPDASNKAKRQASHSEALEQVKAGLIAKAMGYFRKDWDTFLEVDASPVGIGALLYQESPSKTERHVVACWSQLLSDIEQRYSQVEREALGVVVACERFRHYVIGHSFTLITDCKAVELILRNPCAKPLIRIARFVTRLMDYDFNVVHKPGAENMADYLSRRPLQWLEEGSRHSLLAEQFVHFVTTNCAPRAIKTSELALETQRDATLIRVIALVRSGRKDKSPELMRHLTNRHELSVSEDGLLLRDHRIVIPASL